MTYNYTENIGALVQSWKDFMKDWDDDPKHHIKYDDERVGVKKAEFYDFMQWLSRGNL